MDKRWGGWCVGIPMELIVSFRPNYMKIAGLSFIRVSVFLDPGTPRASPSAAQCLTASGYPSKSRLSTTTAAAISKMTFRCQLRRGDPPPRGELR